MSWSWVYLVVSLLGAVLVVNAFRPARHPLFAVPSFFAGWYTAEMPVWHIAWQVAATVVFALGGALGSWPGWVALGINVASWTGLAVHARVSARAHLVFSRAEEETPLPTGDGAVLPVHGGETMWRWPRLLYPLPRPARSVQVIRNVDYAGDGVRAHRLDVIRRRVDPPHGCARPGVHPRWRVGHRRQAGARAPPPVRARPPGLGDGHDQLPPEPSGHLAGPRGGLQAGRGLGARPHLGVRGGPRVHRRVRWVGGWTPRRPLGAHPR